MNHTDNIIPFSGIGSFKLMSQYEDVLALLKRLRLSYTTEIWSNKGCTPAVAWKILHVENKLNLFFAKELMFKIYIDGECDAILPNGISIGMDMKQVKELDSSLKYDDWNEEWISDNGYWIEDDLCTNRAMSISIFIPAMLDEDEFFSYDWCN